MSTRNTSNQARPSLFFYIAFFLFWFAFYAVFMQGVPTGSDSERYFLVAQSLVDRGEVDVAFDPALVLVQGRDGKYFTKFGVGLSLVEAPFYAAGRALSDYAQDPAFQHYYSYFFSMLAIPAASALTLILFMLLNVNLGYSARASLCATVLLGLATLMWPYAHFGFSEPQQACCLAGAVFFALLARRRGSGAFALVSGIFLGALVLTKFVQILVAPFFVFYLMAAKERDIKQRVSQILLLAIPLAALTMGALYFNYARFGNWLDFGYPSFLQGDLSSPLVGLYGLLFSSGKSIFIYTPLIIAALAGARAFHARRRAESVLLWCVAVVVLLLHSAVPYWDGSLCWGPRYLVPLLPLLMLPLSELLSRFSTLSLPGRAGIVLLVLLSFGVQLPGVFVNEYVFENIVPRSVLYVPGAEPDSRLNTRFVPQFSPMAGHGWILKHMLLNRDLPTPELRRKMRSDFPWRKLVDPAKPGEPERDLYPDFWWEHLPRFYPDMAARTKKDLTTFILVSVLTLIAWATAFVVAEKKPGSPGTP